MDIDCSEIFSLQMSGRGGGTLSLSPLDPELPAEDLHLGAVTPEEPVAFRVHERRRLGDVVGTGYAWLHVVSPRVLGS